MAGTNIRASRAAAGARKKRPQALGYSRGGFGSKLHVVSDAKGTILAVRLTAGQTHESTQAVALVDAVRVPLGGRGRPRKRCRAILGDKGYSYPEMRRQLRRRHISPLIPYRRNQRMRGATHQPEPFVYKRRNMVERAIGHLKENRALATRFDKLDVNYLASVSLALIRHALRTSLSSDSV